MLNLYITEMINRLKEFMNVEGITSTQLADNIGVKRPNFSQILTGRSKKISTEIVAKLHKVYPELSINWLISGEGEMYIQRQQKNEKGIASLFDEISINRQDVRDEKKYDEEIIDKNAIKLDKSTEYENIKSDLAVDSKEREISKKVVKIMVFYSDNTFETFSPDIISR